MRYFIAAVGLTFALAFGPAAIAANGSGNSSWGNAANRYGYYHESNG